MLLLLLLLLLQLLQAGKWCCQPGGTAACFAVAGEVGAPSDSLPLHSCILSSSTGWPGTQVPCFPSLSDHAAPRNQKASRLAAHCSSRAQIYSRCPAPALQVPTYLSIMPPRSR